MANIVIMPQIGLNETSNLISTWNKNEGDPVQIGDVLFSVETDKSSMDVESEFQGILLKQLYQEGDACDVLEPVCIIGELGEDISGIMVQEDDEEIPQDKEEIVVQTDNDNNIVSAPKHSKGNGGISPRAKNLAEKKGLNPEDAVASGPEGRIIERDIREPEAEGKSATKAASLVGDINGFDEGTGIGGKIITKDILTKNTNTPAPVISEHQEYVIEKFPKIRQVIGENMMKSLQNTAQLTINSSFDATALLNYRKAVKNSGETTGLSNITLNDMVLYGVSRTVGKFKYLNAHMIDNTQIKIFSDVHVGFACDTDRGLMVPTIFNIDKLSLNDISQTSKSLAQECQKGNIDPMKLQGATFTVSNLGSFGVESFTPVINPPQTGILGIGTIEYKIKKSPEGFVEYPAMFISLTIDHRAVDGAPAARFLQELKLNLENFNLLLAK